MVPAPGSCGGELWRMQGGQSVQHAETASAASVASMRGSARAEPSACGMPVAIPAEIAETTCPAHGGNGREEAGGGVVEGVG